MFTGSAGKYVSLEDTIAGFKGIIAGEYDGLPEQAFYMVGGYRRGGRARQKLVILRSSDERYRMMAMSMLVNIVSAEGEIFSGSAEMVIAPAKMGEVGVAAGHAPLITPLKAGEVRVQSEGREEQHIFVSGGMLEVQPRELTVLADTAIRAADLDEAKALKAKELGRTGIGG